MIKHFIFSIVFLLCLGYAQGQEQLVNTGTPDSDSISYELDKSTQTLTDKSLWGRGRFSKLGYAFTQTCNNIDPVEKSKVSIFLAKGTTFRFPSHRSIGGILKFGVDVIWYDFQFSSFGTRHDENLKWTSDIDTSGRDEEDEALSDFTASINIGMGVGPSLSVVPFASSGNNGLKPLRFSVYFHYSPTVAAYLMNNGIDSEVSTAFCNMFDFGFNIHYKFIGIGIEGRWGKGKFKPFDFEEEMNISANNKYTRNFANTRLYIQFSI